MIQRKFDEQKSQNAADNDPQKNKTYRRRAGSAGKNLMQFSGVGKRRNSNKSQSENSEDSASDLFMQNVDEKADVNVVVNVDDLISSLSQQDIPKKRRRNVASFLQKTIDKAQKHEKSQCNLNDITTRFGEFAQLIKHTLLTAGFCENNQCLIFEKSHIDTLKTISNKLYLSFARLGLKSTPTLRDKEKIIVETIHQKNNKNKSIDAVTFSNNIYEETKKNVTVDVSLTKDLFHIFGNDGMFTRDEMTQLLQILDKIEIKEDDFYVDELQYIIIMKYLLYAVGNNEVFDANIFADSLQVCLSECKINTEEKNIEPIVFGESIKISANGQLLKLLQIANDANNVWGNDLVSLLFDRYNRATMFTDDKNYLELYRFVYQSIIKQDLLPIHAVGLLKDAFANYKEMFCDSSSINPTVKFDDDIFAFWVYIWSTNIIIRTYMEPYSKLLPIQFDVCIIPNSHSKNVITDISE
eukprot:458749_1